MRRYIRLMARDELGGGGQTGDLRIRERAARREKGEREGKSVGDERSRRDPREGGCEDEWLQLNSKDVIVFGGFGVAGGGKWCFLCLMVVRASDGDWLQQ